jgi:hypothetical protein
MNYFLGSTRVHTSIDCCWLQGWTLVGFCIAHNLKLQCLAIHETLGVTIFIVPFDIGIFEHWNLVMKFMDTIG